MDTTQTIKLLDNKEYPLHEVIDKAREDDYYYGFLSKTALSSSLITNLLNSPAEYLLSITEEQKEIPAFLLGGAIHVSLLEEHRLNELYTHSEMATRNSKAHKDTVLAERRRVLTKPEWSLMEKIQDKLINLEEFAYRRELSTTEVPAIGEIFGIPFRAKADMLDEVNGCVYDLKTTSSIKDFKRSAYKYNYDAQAYIYCKLFGVEFDKFEFLVVDKSTLEFGIFKVSEKAFEIGEQKVKQGIEIYKKFFLGKTKEETIEAINKHILYDSI